MSFNLRKSREIEQESGMVERQTAKLPTDAYIWAAGASIAGALAMKVMGRDKDAEFIGQWAPTLLLFSIIGKLARTLGNDD